MSRRLRNIKPRKVNRGAFEEQKQREEKKLETQRALLFILPLLMIAVLLVGIFFGYKFYQNENRDHDAVAPSDAAGGDSYASNPMFYRAVSSATPLDQSFVPETEECCGVQVAPEMKSALERLVADGREKGYDFLVREGYISFEEQKTRYEKMVETYRKDKKASLVMAEVQVRRTIPPAGESEQQTGLLVDLSVKTDGKFADTPAYAWLVRNCVSYGFILRYPDQENTGGLAYNSHLFRFVGEENAYRMRALDMSFDRYIRYISAH